MWSGLCVWSIVCACGDGWRRMGGLYELSWVRVWSGELFVASLFVDLVRDISCLDCNDCDLLNVCVLRACLCAVMCV